MVGGPKDGWDRRDALRIGAAALVALPGAAFAQSQRRTRLILLGTKGGPTPSRTRAPAAAVLIVDGRPYLIDAPDGVARQLVMVGVDLARVGSVFISHLHSDHVAGLGAFLSLSLGTGLLNPVTVYGPQDTKRVVKGALAAGTPDIEFRMREEGRPDPRKLVRPVELKKAATFSPGGGVRVTAVQIAHFTVPNIAYRFDTPDRSIVFSGDTTPSPALIQLARGADVLVHEAMLASAISRIVDPNAPRLHEHLVRSHTTTEQLGQVAAAAGVKTVVLTHLVPAFPDLTDAMWAAGVRRFFKGQVIVGRDLMEL